MKKKINLNRPQVSSDEISQRKDFDSVLKGQAGSTAISKALIKKPWFLSSVVAVIVAVVTIVVLMKKEESNSVQPQSQKQETLNSDSLELAAFYAAEEAKPCVNPPLKGLNISSTIFTVIAEKGGSLMVETGSKLIVPKNAFSDGNGNLIKGEVELRYREFHDAVDIFLSGIPMTYDSAGTRYHFESAGMIELTGFQNGKKVNIAAGKKIDVEMASEYPGTKYNLYELDTIKNNWTCLGKDKVVEKKNATTETDNIIVGKKDIKESPPYIQIEKKRKVIELEIEKKISVLPKMNPAPTRPNRASKDQYTFDLDVDTTEFPELGVYKGLLFEVGEETKNFSNKLYDVTWDNATIKEGSKPGENYTIILQKGQKSYEVIANPVYEGKNYEVAVKTFQEKFNTYSKLLDNRKAEEKKIAAQYQANLLVLKKEQEAWEKKWQKDEEDHYKKLSTEGKLLRVFSVNNFGYFNADCPLVRPGGVDCIANLTGSGGHVLHVYGVYHVDKLRNALFTYTRNPLTTFSFNPKVNNLLWTVESGILYYMEQDGFESIKDGETQILKMKKLEQQFSTAEEMKAFFKL
ncbi:MAG: hypothetical protein M3R27_01180 [Bacteroidota bacterium]|nr:hypothetical protein [Bacteroidota bacterium]